MREGIGMRDKRQGKWSRRDGSDREGKDCLQILLIISVFTLWSFYLVVFLFSTVVVSCRRLI